MPSKYTINASVTEHLHAFVETQIVSGRFSTASEVVRAALRSLERDLEGEAALSRVQRRKPHARSSTID